MTRAFFYCCLFVAIALAIFAIVYFSHQHSFTVGGTAAYMIVLAIPVIAWLAVRTPFSVGAGVSDIVSIWIGSLFLTISHYFALELVVVHIFGILSPVEFLNYRAAYMAGAGGYGLCWSLAFLVLGVSRWLGRRRQREFGEVGK